MSAINFTIYNQTTGKIRCIVGCPEDELGFYLKAGEAYIEGQPEDAMLSYVENGVLALKMPNPCVLSGMTITEIPGPAMIRIGLYDLYPCDDGTAELSFNLPGTYMVTVECFPYLDKIFEVTNG